MGREADSSAALRNDKKVEILAAAIESNATLRTAFERKKVDVEHVSHRFHEEKITYISGAAL
jgi:hypothetical protein